MVKDFNDNVVCLLERIMQNAPVENIKYYYLDLSGYPRNVSVKHFNLDNGSIDNQYLNYYWAEFDYEKERYKLNMFYRDFDRNSGNIHVLPGVPQLWKRKDNSPDDEKNFVITKCSVSRKYFDVNEILNEYSGSIPYSEPKWSPVVIKISRNIKMMWSAENTAEIAGDFWKVFPNKSGFTGCSTNSYEMYSDELVSGLYGRMKSGGRGMYRLLKWRDNRFEHIMTAYQKMLYTDDGYFCIYDGNPHKLSLEKNKKGPNYIIPVDNGYQWKICYDYIG